jgi:signal transduction histidine kinase
MIGHALPEHRAPRLSGAARVWVLNLFLAVCAVALMPAVARFDRLDAPLMFPLFVMVALFALAEVFPIYLQIRREAYTYTLSEIALVIGIYFADPVDVVLGQCIGAFIILAIHRRQTLLKLIFNVSHFTVEAALATIVFHSLASGSDPLGPVAWTVTFAAVLGTIIVAHLAVGFAIGLSESSFSFKPMLTGLGTGVGVSFTNVSLAFVGVTVMWLRPSSAWFLVLPVIILFVAFRAYSSQREKRESLEVLYGTTRSMQHTLEIEPAIMNLLGHARAMFRAEVAQLTMWTTEDPTTGLRSSLGPGEMSASMIEIDLDPREGIWARVAAEGQALLFPKPIQNDRLRVHFASRNIKKDAMVAPVFSGEMVVGTLLVGDRLGDVSTFDDEDLKLLETFANHASVSLENARLVDRLQQSLAHLTEMNRLKDDFVAAVSHELRTPLTSIQGYVKTLLRPGAEKLPDEQRRSFLEAVDRQGERLRRLIEDLLVVSRLEAHEMSPVIGRVDVAGVIAQVLTELREKAAGFEVDVEVAPGLPPVQTDEGKVLQIVSNLVDNAFKYSPRGGKVTLHASQSGEGIQISVSDTGAGIPEEMTEKVFDRFYQVDQSSTREVGGTGLGLYICRRLAEALGGRVWIERTGPTGSTFSLWVPATLPVPVTANL